MTPDVVRVTWVDAGHRHDWGTAGEVARWVEDARKFTILTAGFLIGESDDWVLIAPSYTDEGMAHSPIRILKISIISMEVLDGNKETKFD